MNIFLKNCLSCNKATKIWYGPYLKLFNDFRQYKRYSIFFFEIHGFNEYVVFENQGPEYKYFSLLSCSQLVQTLKDIVNKGICCNNNNNREVWFFYKLSYITIYKYVIDEYTLSSFDSIITWVYTLQALQAYVSVCGICKFLFCYLVNLQNWVLKTFLWMN